MPMPSDTLTRDDADVHVLWAPDKPFPTPAEMQDLDIVTHVVVARAVYGGFHYLHEPAIAQYRGLFHLCWANHPVRERNTHGEQIRGTQSFDGIHWAPAIPWLVPPEHGSESWNHPVIASAFDRLWGFFTRWNDEVPSTEIFIRQDDASWQTTGTRIPGFIPFRAPERLRNGNWMLSGELGWTEAAVAISRGDNFGEWRNVVLPRPPGLELRYPEATLMTRDDGLVAIMRPRDMDTAPVSVSRDCGESWSAIVPSNLPMWRSQPLCGRLSTGQQYLLFNCSTDAGRTLLAIAVTEPGGAHFCRVWKVRHQKYPLRRVLGGSAEKGSRVGSITEWSYPSAIEADGSLYVAYTQGKEDCALSIIPLSALA